MPKNHKQVSLQFYFRCPFFTVVNADGVCSPPTWFYPINWLRRKLAEAMLRLASMTQKSIKVHPELAEAAKEANEQARLANERDRQATAGEAPKKKNNYLRLYARMALLEGNPAKYEALEEAGTLDEILDSVAEDANNQWKSLLKAGMDDQRVRETVFNQLCEIGRSPELDDPRDY